MSYYLDTKLGPDEQERQYAHHDRNGLPIRAPSADFYWYAIRSTEQPGWVFRFAKSDAAFAQQTLAALNYQARAAA